MTPTAVDFWDDAANNTDVAEPPKPEYSDLPDGASVLVRTTSLEDKETVHPKIKAFDRKDGNGQFFIAKIPVIVVGGDTKITPKMVGRYLFTDFNIEKPTAAQLETRIASSEAQGFESTATRLKGQLKALDKYPCAPETYNFLLDCLSPEGKDTIERWQTAVAKLRAKATEAGLTLESCQGNSQYLIVASFVEVLRSKQFKVIGKIYTPKQRPGSAFTPQQTVGSIGSYTEAEAKRRKVKVIEVPMDGGF